MSMLYTKNMENQSKWHTQISKGVVEVAIMVLLAQQPMYGYEITKQIQTGGTLSIANGSIYPILRRLVEQRWVTAYQEEHDGRMRKYYRLTPEGEDQLKARLSYMQELFDFLQTMEKGGKGHGRRESN